MAFSLEGSTLIKGPKVVDFRVERPYDEDTGEYTMGPTVTVHTVATFVEGDHHHIYVATILDPADWNHNAVAVAETYHVQQIFDVAPNDPMGILPTLRPTLPVLQT